MTKLLKTVLILFAVLGLHQIASADTYNVTLDTAPLIGDPAGPFVVFLAFADGSGIGDANNTVTLSGVDFSGGSALGSPIVFGGASGSLASGISITDSSVFSFLEEGFDPGLALSFSLGLTNNDDAGGTPDRFTLFVLDSLGVPIPTLAPAGDYFLGADLGSGGPVFDVWPSDPTRPLSVGGPVTIPAPNIAAVPEPSTIWLVGTVLAGVTLIKRLLSHR